MKRGPSQALVVALTLLVVGCAAETGGEGGEVLAFTGARLWDGTGRSVVEDGVLLVRDGRIAAAGPRSEIGVPSDATVHDFAGLTIVPGLVNTHGHVGGVLGLEDGHYDTDNLLRQLSLYAAYGVTAVNSLGGDGPEGIALRDAQDTPDLERARLYVAGAVVAGDTPAAAVAVAAGNADAGVDWVKIRVDDNLGTTTKMAPAIYEAVIEAAHARGLRLASHLFYLEDAKGLLRSGTDFVAHSIRDLPVDEEVVALFRARDVCYSPTLMREVSTFVYGREPEFFADPFFLKRADTAAMRGLRDPERQARVRDNPASAAYEGALEVAKRNLKSLSDEGVTIAFGTDTGPPGRFQGYFEILELELMAEAGMSPEQILRSATGDAARCIGRDDIGVLEAGRWADFVVIDGDPLADIRAFRQLQSVWIAGNRVSASP